MKQLNTLITLALAYPALMLSCTQQQSNTERLNFENFNQQKIVGGSVVSDLEKKPQSVPRSIIQILSDSPDGNYFTCSATLIRQDIIITAAHCVILNEKNEFVAKTQLKLDDPEILEPITVVHYMTHPLFRMGPNSIDGYDVAILKLSRPLPASYSPVPMVSENQIEAFSGNWTALGYGRTEVPDAPVVLRQVPVQRLNIAADDWSLLTQNFNQPSGRQLIIDQSLQKGLCFGDSGGPILTQIGDQSFLIGVNEAVSAEPASAKLCSGKSFASSVLFHRDFILRAIEKLSSAETLPARPLNDRYFNANGYKGGVDLKDLRGATQHLLYAKVYKANDPRTGFLSLPDQGQVLQFTGEEHKDCSKAPRFSKPGVVMSSYIRDLTQKWSSELVKGFVASRKPGELAIDIAISNTEALMRLEPDGRLNVIFEPMQQGGKSADWNTSEVRKTLWKLIDCRDANP